MARNPIYPHELVGKDVEILDSTNKTLVGMKGRIVDETKSTIVINTLDGSKTILKRGIKLALVNQDQRIILSLDEMIQKPENRIKGK